MRGPVTKTATSLDPFGLILGLSLGLAHWAKVEFLVEHGFVFPKIYREISPAVFVSVRYPETLADAREFVERYADQACKVPPSPPIS